MDFGVLYFLGGKSIKSKLFETKWGGTIGRENHPPIIPPHFVSKSFEPLGPGKLRSEKLRIDKNIERVGRPNAQRSMAKRYTQVDVTVKAKARVKTRISVKVKPNARVKAKFEVRG